MAITVLPIDASAGAPSYTAQQTRQAFSALMGPAPAGRPLGVRSGVRQGTPSTTVSLSGTGSMTWTVAAHAGIIDAETAAAGPYLYATDGTDTGTITAANATNPRIDIIYVQVNDAVQDGSGQRGGVVGYLAGVAGATPYAPAAPARSMVLATINVPASGGGNPAATWAAPSYLGYDGMLRQTGTIQVSGNVTANFGTVTGTITFPVPYSTPAAYVDAQISGFVTGASTLLVQKIDQITATGARVTLVNASTTNAPTITNLPVAWSAVGTP